MELWFTEQHSKDLRFLIKVTKQVYSVKSDFQNICIFDSEEFGRFLVIDDYLMLTEKDEFIYHEMISHVPISTNLNLKNILVIGGGDGGTVREIVKYSNDMKIDVCEIDSVVVDACKKYLPSVACGFNDKRVKIYFEDGTKFVKNINNKYDLIIIDSTDPFGPGEALFTEEFYYDCFNALTENGILVNQHESVFYSEYIQQMIKVNKNLKNIFPICEIYQAHIPTYPSGHWLFGFASKTIQPTIDFKSEGWNNLDIKTKYYNTNLHIGAFMLPNYVKEKFS
ncbi:MAG: polyamine aminopropyltransferase [Clostridiales bacterium]|jgi:spermidine synthase|nr:polyamine aminopropyltransferase [Clostridiales bacterium]